MSMSASKANNRPTPNRPARRKRAATRRMRRFEGVLAQLPVVQMDWRATLQGVQAPPVLLPTPWAWSKLLSFMLLLASLSVLTVIHSQDDWYLYNDQIRVAPLVRLAPAEVAAAAGIDGWNIFWIDPDAVRERLLAHRWIEEAQVEIGLPPAMHIQVAERMPIAVWITNAGSYWVTEDGTTLPMSEGEAALPTTLPRIVDSLGEAATPFIDDAYPVMDEQILDGALALLATLPELDGAIRYNRSIGLNFPLPDPGIWVYWGDGLLMEAKLENLTAARLLLAQGETEAQILDVRFPERPYVR